MPEPEDWVTWFQNHPYLETTKPDPVSVGSASGVHFDVEVASAPENYPESCPAPCVSMYPLSDETPVEFVMEGPPSRLTILDVEGETVLIDITGFPEASEEEFERFIPVAQEVLDTVEWKAAP